MSFPKLILKLAFTLGIPFVNPTKFPEAGTPSKIKLSNVTEPGVAPAGNTTDATNAVGIPSSKSGDAMLKLNVEVPFGIRIVLEGRLIKLITLKSDASMVGIIALLIVSNCAWLIRFWFIDASEEKSKF
jgi:hypothetical protein